jgi:hypothetical protein
MCRVIGSFFLAVWDDWKKDESEFVVSVIIWQAGSRRRSMPVQLPVTDGQGTFGCRYRRRETIDENGCMTSMN